MIADEFKVAGDDAMIAANPLAVTVATVATVVVLITTAGAEYNRKGLTVTTITQVRNR